MLTAGQLDSIQIVLVSPRNPLNIGAAARAMANFGFSHLSVVAPYEPHWREAQSAVGAETLLQNAKSAERLADAVKDCTLVIGTGTLAARKAEQPVVPLPDLGGRVAAELARGGRIALVFGSEKRGLSRDDLSCCHLLSVIPTHPDQPSMNLGQAVAVCLYQLASRACEPATPQLETSESRPPTSGELDRLAGVIDDVMLACRYSPEEMREANRHDLRLFLRRLALDEPDARRALGLFRRILHKLKS
ncbi:MAG TPA: RNA methyltransferase [Terracidiphilus sp.]|nr:RNA methyltransferase [Terracidiphilus sp.]